MPLVEDPKTASLALQRLSREIMGGQEERNSDKCAAAIERFCAVLGINLLDVIGRRLNRTLDDAQIHSDDCHRAPSMGMRCTCGGRVLVQIPLGEEDAEIPR